MQLVIFLARYNVYPIDFDENAISKNRVCERLNKVNNRCTVLDIRGFDGTYYWSSTATRSCFS